MRLPEVDFAIEQCKDYLNRTNSLGTPIESYLTRYLLVLIYSEFERVVKEILSRRLSLANDPHTESFSRFAVDRLIRSIKISEIAGVLGRFGSDYKAEFDEKVVNDPLGNNFDSIINNRHISAHGPGATVTFRDMETYYEESHVVLDQIQSILFPNSPEGTG